MTDLEQFERGAKRHLSSFTEGKPKPKRPEPMVSALKGYTVTLRVRKKQLAPDESFVYQSQSGSEFMATHEARKAARAAGWPIITYVIDCVPMYR